MMESQRKQKWDHQKRHHNKPRGNWQPTVPSWEKRFCKVVGLMDWEKLMQLKKFMHLYENVIDWNDSAGEEAFRNAKKRFWADLNGLSCDISLPDPDLYIDQINWDEDVDVELLSDLERCRRPVISNTEDGPEVHEPVVIFGDSLLPNQSYSPTGWGDAEENIQQIPAYAYPTTHVDSWDQNMGNEYGNNAWDFNNGHGPDGYGTWGYGWNDGWNDDGNWNYTNYFNHQVAPHFQDKRADEECGWWDDRSPAGVYTGGYMSNHTSSMAQVKDSYWNYTSPNDRGQGQQREATYLRDQSSIDKRQASRKWNSYNSRPPMSNKPTIAVGQRRER